MNAETLSARKVQHWLTKTSRSIQNCPGSTDMERNGRKAALCSRYNELKDRALELGVWQEYCDSHGWAPNHDGFDCAA